MVFGSYFTDVGDFHRKFGLPNDSDTAPALLAPDLLRFRVGFMLEELAEFCAGHGLHSVAGDLKAITNNLNGQYPSGAKNGVLEPCADALADLTYVVLGTAQMMGLPFDDVWSEVQRANMEKERATGADDARSKRRHALDVVKPLGWRAPSHEAAIRRATEAHRDRF